jgi:ketosteroid isomerase-like protein
MARARMLLPAKSRCATTVRWLFLTLPLLSCAHAQTARSPADSLAAAERAFAKDASERTVNEAFLKVFAPDVTLFRPLPVNGQSTLAQRPMRADLELLWTPAYAEASADGSLGFTTGPATAGTRGKNDRGASWFVSVWKRVDGAWKLRSDAGIAAPAIESLDSAAKTLVVHNSTRRFSDDGAMMRAEQQLIADYQHQFATLAAADVRAYRNGHRPTSTRDQAIALVNMDSAASYTIVAAETAGSGDLGFVYGTINAGSAEPHAYERIYRRDASGQWRIAADWRN